MISGWYNYLIQEQDMESVSFSKTVESGRLGRNKRQRFNGEEDLAQKLNSTSNISAA